MPTYGLRDQNGTPIRPPSMGPAKTESAPAAPRSQPQGPIQNPGNNLTNQGYTEQAFEHMQNRLLEDPYAAYMQQAAQQALTPTQGETWMNENLGTLMGPGAGDQYWSQVQGQYMDPFAGEQFARQATADFAANGPSSAFYDQAMGQYGDFTNYSGPQNTQGQYNASSAQLAGGTQGENYLGQLAGQYDQMGQYSGPNLAAGQYSQTQQAFGDLPIANFDPFYDRARQLATQDYNRQAAGRGVYGSSEALSGVGNVITDIEAQRANRSFDAEMQRAAEQRARQQLLGEQARMGDLSSLGAFQANLQGVSTFGNIGQAMGNLELDRHQTLGNMANNADSQALGAQNANIAGLNAYGAIANNADVNQTRRYEATTNAMNQADRTALDRLNSGADIAFRGDENRRANYETTANVANNAASAAFDRTRLGADIADRGSRNDLSRLESTMDAARTAELDRQSRQNSRISAQTNFSNDVGSAIQNGLNAALSGNQQDWENTFNAQLAPMLQAAGYSQQEIETFRKDAMTTISVLSSMGENAPAASGAAASRTPNDNRKRPLDPNPY